MSAPQSGPRRWPLALIAAPAAVAVWSGWVGLGGLCGFGVIRPLPGIAGGLQLNTAITLPVGVEAYGAYALAAWAHPRTPVRARAFARRSAVGALGLGMAGQVAYHLLAAAHAARAPWPVVVLVSCLPVATLGLGTALTHLVRHGDPAPYGPGEAYGPAAYARTGPDADGTGPAGPALPPGSRAALPPGGAEARAVVAAELAAQITAAAAAGRTWRPDYPALMTRTGFGRSWCEKAVRAARDLAAADPAAPR